MPAFEYDALNPAGRHKRGIGEAETARQVRQQLRKQGLTPVSVSAIEKKQADDAGGIWTIARLPASEISLMTRQLATLVRAGLPLDDALQALSEQVENKHVRHMVLAIRGRVLEGHSLSEAMSPYRRALSDLYIATIAAGEHSRDLAFVLERLADYSESRQAMQQKIRIAMIYPAILAMTALLVTMGLLVYVVPEVVQVFENSQQQLPLLTRLLIAASDFFRDWWWLLLLAVLALIVLAGWLFTKESVRRRWHQLLLATPVLKNLVRQAEAARFTRTLGILLGSGVPMLESLRIGCRALLSLPVRSAVEGSMKKVSEGEPLHSALKESRQLPPLTIHLIANGEASGNLENMLESAAEAHERNLQTSISTFLGLLEPILILLMGCVVLIIVIAILLPIFELNQLI